MAAGVYTVSLTVEGPGGTDTEIKPGYVEVEESPCPVEQTLGQDGRSVNSYRGLRDEVFVRSIAGRRYTALYQKHAGEVARLLARDPQLAAQAASLLRRWQPAVESLVAMEASTGSAGPRGGVGVETEATRRRVTAEDVAAAREVLTALAERGSPQLRADLEPVLKQLDSFAGHTPAEIWGALEKEAEEQREKPAEGEAGPPQSSLLLPDLSLLLVPLVVATLGRRKRWQRWTTPLAVVLLAVAVMGFGATVAQAGEPVAELQRPALSELVLSLSKGEAEGSSLETLAGSGFPLAPVPAALPSSVSLPASSPAASVQAAETITTTRVISYTYDPLGRLVDAEYSTGEQFEYQYDAVSNRTALTETTSLDETTVTTYTYDAANRLIVSVSPGHLVSYDWDDRGNLVGDGTFTYAYNGAGRMVACLGTNRLAESVTATLVYTYNAQGLRVAQSVQSVGESVPSVDTFAWDWASGIPEMLTQSPNPPSPNPQSLYLVGHDTVGRWDGTTWAYHLPDALGSVRQVADGAGAVTAAREWTPYGVEVGGGQAGLGYTGEWFDGRAGLLYLQARWYDPPTGRFLTKDSFPGLVFLPPTQHAYVYAANDPIRYTDSTGNITEEHAPEADRIVQWIDRCFDIEVVKDWGGWSTPLPHPAPGMPGNICSWNPGRWTIPELRLVYFTISRMAAAMGGETVFRGFMGRWEVSKTPSACGRGCTRDSLHRVELIDKDLPPDPGLHPSLLIVRSTWEINFDAWTVVHELGHAWDANSDWRLSKGLEGYTGGFTISPPGKYLLRDWLRDYCDADNRRPGCNEAGYVYVGIPPKGSDVNFNRKEDFAESVAAYVFPDEAQGVIEHFFGTEYEDLLWYADYRDTPRWQYVNGLIDGTITVP